jgi:hypothetical protein
VLKLHIHGGDLVEIYIFIHGDSKVHGEKETGPSKVTIPQSAWSSAEIKTIGTNKRPAIYLSIHGSDTIHGSDLG